MAKFQSNQKLGDIVIQFPNATKVFKKYRIDFCCGGNRPLKEAIDEAGLDEATIVNEINALYEEFKNKDTGDKDFVHAPLDELIDHIVNVHHAYLYENLPYISELTTKILRVHGENHPELSRVYRLFHQIKMELEEHLIKEETIQYPAIRAYLESGDQKDLKKAIDIIKTLDEEHVGAGNILKELRQITKDFTCPSDGCNTYRATYRKLNEFEEDLFQHIHLENNILFPRLVALHEIKCDHCE